MDKLYDKIEQYLLGELKGEELVEFEKQMQKDNTLAEEVELVRKMRHSLSDQFQHEKEEIALKQTLTKTAPKYFPQKEKPKFKIRRLWLSVAAAAMITLALLVWQPWLSSSPFDQYYQAPLAQLSDRSSNSSVDIETMETVFNKGNYSQALPLIEKYLQQQADDLEVLILKGICQLELDQFDEAQATFETIHAGSSAYKSQGTWYLALTYLKQNDQSKCIEYLRQIPADADRYGEAQGLLQRLS